jgi:hypothetical protein
MAYVVARPNGRFEIRESVHTPLGPRARSLANFALLTEDVLAAAKARADRPFDPIAVLAAADRAGVPITPGARRASAPAKGRGSKAASGFVESSRRMAKSTKSRSGGKRTDPGQVLMELLGFVDQVTPFRDAPAEPLLFPPLARLAAARRGKTKAAPRK